MSESRAELEMKLQSASERMTKRLSSLENEVRLPTVTELTDSLPEGTTRKVAFAVGAGLLVGLVAGGIGKASRIRRREDWQDRLADAVARYLRDGQAPDKAVEHALGKQPPPRSDAKAPSGLLTFILGYAVRQGTNALVREIVNRVSARNGAQQG